MPYDYYYKPSKPKEAKDGIKARNSAGPLRRVGGPNVGSSPWSDWLILDA
jgi:hypothetical protein